MIVQNCLRILATACVVFSTSLPAAGKSSDPRKRGLLVVAPARFHRALEVYVTHKRRQLPTRLVALERILARTPAVDDPEKLKRYLYGAWKDKGVGYVVLVGDADVLPVRYMVLDRITPSAFDYAFYPSDLYYADLARRRGGSFDDWNARKGKFHARYFGEVRGEKNKDDPINFDAIDYLPDVAVGRWPVSSETEVRIVARKTVAYEKGLPKRPRPRRAALVCVAGWVDCRGRMDRWSRSLSPGWTVEKRYYGGGSARYHTPPPSAAEITRLLNDGVRLVLHAGHGKDKGWEGSFSLANLPQLRNADRLCVMASAGCSTARFATLPPYEAYVDTKGRKHRGTNRGEIFTEPPPPPAPYQRGRYNPPGLGEVLVRRGPTGSVAYIGCNTGGQPCGITLLEGLVKGLQSDGPHRLGDCWNRAIVYYFEKERLAQLVPTKSWYPASIFFQGMKFMLFGDPSLLLAPP